MNQVMEDIGVLQGYEMDLAFGESENDFECRVSMEDHCCGAGYYLYADGTEYGGIIDSIESDKNNNEVIYSGRTWHGVLNSKVLEPDAGEAYLVLSGEANAILAKLIARMGLSDLFKASGDASGLTVNNYKMNRYITGYDGIRKMLASAGGKLHISFCEKKAVLSAVPRHDYSKDEEFDADLVSFKAKKNFNAVNHLVCLGSGELTDRMVVHLYADENGAISQKQTFTGKEEVSAIYEYSNVESLDDLIREGTDKLKELRETADSIDIDFDADSDSYDVGDIVGAVDNVTGLSVAAAIAKKIVSIKKGQITISYGSAKGQSSSGSSGGSGGGGSPEPSDPSTPGVNLDSVYPPGTVYLNVNQVDPGALFGGTWERIENSTLPFFAWVRADGVEPVLDTATLDETMILA